MKTNWKAGLAKKLGMVVVAGGMSLGIASAAHGDAITVGDASFEDHNIDSHAGTVDYAYSDDGGNWVDGYSPGAGGDSAWTSRESGGAGGWIYNAAYAIATGRSGPRTGVQAISGAGGYTYQALVDVFEPNTTYLFNVYSANTTGSSRLFLYIYDGTVTMDGGDDGDNLASSGSVDNFGMVAPDGTGTWQLNTLRYTTGAAGAEIGHSIGLSFWTSGNVFIEDVSLTAIPEPSSLAFISLAFAGLGVRRKR